VKRDSYLNFLEKFNISNEDFIEYGLNDIIFVPNDKVISEWDILKNKVYSNQEVYIRGMGRDAASTQYMLKVHKSLFGNSNIKKDPSNNAHPTKILENLTGFSKRKLKNSILISNYQVSHIFGHTKNALMFMAPWNIVYIPKLFDPFSGHESKGELTQIFSAKLKEITYEKFKVQIDDYNSIVNNSKFIDSLNSSIEKLESNNSEISQKLLNSIKDEFSEVKI
jgi:hypothetical protein